MKQSFHIFAKDTRHLYPEILLSLAITLAFVKIYPVQWGAQVTTIWFPPWVPGFITGLVPVSWWLLIARAVQDESLVGERQFWITRPYTWQSLIAAKSLFIVAYILVPFFIALCLLLRMAGFHPFAYLPGLIFNLAMAICIIVTPLFVVASITGTFGKMTLWLLGIIAFVGAVAYVATWLPAADATTDLGTHAWATVVECSFIAIILLQYIKRKTTLSRILLGVVACTIAAFGLVGPNDLPMKLAYPAQPTAGSAALKLTFNPTQSPSTDESPERDNASEVEVAFPLRISGIAAGTAMKADSAKVSISAPSGDHWTSHWQEIYLTWLPGQVAASIHLKISRKFFNRIKHHPVTADLSIAITALKAGKPTRIRLADGPFTIPGGAICHTKGIWNSDVDCLSPLRQPPLLLVATRFNTIPCSADTVLLNDGDNGLGWIGSIDTDPAEFGLTSVWTSGLNFERFASPQSSKPQFLCPGSTLLFAPYTVAERRQQNVTSPLISLGDYTAKMYM